MYGGKCYFSLPSNCEKHGTVPIGILLDENGRKNPYVGPVVGLNTPEDLQAMLAHGSVEAGFACRECLRYYISQSFNVFED
jgi:hypothetical protein